MCVRTTLHELSLRQLETQKLTMSFYERRTAMIGICDTPTISQQDVVDAVKHWNNENGEETTEIVLNFASELTGISVDKIMENM